jgi:DNA primase
MENHLKSRGMDTSLYRCSLTEDSATFYLYNLSGQIVGYHVYRPNSPKKHNNPKDAKYFTYCKHLGVFGLEYENPNDDRTFVVEGIFKAATLHRLGYNAIAVLGATPKHLKGWFGSLGRNLVAIGDDDAAGRQLVSIVRKGITSTDIDEMADADIHQMLKDL